MVMLDFSKTFYVVSHVVLLDKLRAWSLYCVVELDLGFFVKSQNVCRCWWSIQQCQNCVQWCPTGLCIGCM